jgi:hypothetical protein
MIYRCNARPQEREHAVRQADELFKHGYTFYTPTKQIITISLTADFISINDILNKLPLKKFPEKFRAFISRSPNVTTDKPESVSYIMTSSVRNVHEIT